MKRTIPTLKQDETQLSGLLFKKSKPFIENLSTDHDSPDIMKPVWVDEDEEQFGANAIPDKKSTAYISKLKQKYECLMGTPSWAKIDKVPNEDADTEILRKVGHVQKKKSSTLPKNFLEIRKYPYLNYETRAEGRTISCIEFHPKLSVALVAGESGVVSLFSIGGDKNNKLHSFQLKRWQVSAAQFSPTGSDAYLATMKDRYYCLYNLVKAEPNLIQLPRCIKRPNIFKLSPDGKYLVMSEGFEEVHIICAASNERLRALKHNSAVEDVSFSHNSNQLYCYCIQGDITVWDLSTYKAVTKFYDNGCVNAARISNSLCGKLLATGSAEGIVNIYDTSNLTTSLPLPMKTVSNLRTKITDLKFNATTEILAVSSNCYPNSVKLVHIPSYHVFSNFPAQAVDFNNIETINFSPNSGYLGMGNNKGIAYLYRLKYYRNY